MPSRQLFANNARGTLASGISDSAVSVTVGAGEGARFGTSPGANEFIYATLRNAAGSVTEIVKITAISGDTFTIVRGQESTAAQAFTAGDTISLRWTKDGATRMAQKDANETITGSWAFPAPVNAGDVTNKSYVDALSLNRLAVDTAVDAADLVQFYDSSVPADRKITFDNFRQSIFSKLKTSSFRAASSATTSLPNNTTTNIALASESFDPGNNFASSQYTVPHTGIYLIQGTIRAVGTPTANSTLTGYIRVNTGYYYIGAALMPPSINQVWLFSGSLILSLTAGQTVGLSIHHNSGATLTAEAGASNVLAGFFIRE
jgi:hypothetical protein